MSKTFHFYKYVNALISSVAHYLISINLIQPFNRTIPLLTTLRKEALLKTFRKKRENPCNQHFFPFPRMCFTIPRKNFNFSATYILSSASALNFDWNKILSFSTELN